MSLATAATISEVAAAGKPAIFVPSPNVTDNHQEKNARIIEEQGGALVLREAECSGDILFETAQRLLTAPEKLQAMGRAAEALAVPDSAQQILNLMLELSKR